MNRAVTFGNLLAVVAASEDAYMKKGLDIMRTK